MAMAVLAEGDQAYLGIFAETSVHKMAGMPEMPAMPGMANMPGMPAMPSMGAPARKLSVRLWSPSIAPKSAFAYLVPPKGLLLGDKLNLELYRPTAQRGGKGEVSPDQVPNFTIKIYWGSSETVKQGQPKIIKFDSLSPEMKEAMREEARKAANTDPYFYKPNWTTGYWPTPKQPGQISPQASLVGTYSLTTNYTGNVALDAPRNVEFLAPYELSSPSFKQLIPMDKSIKFAWKAIPNLLGQHAAIYGMEGQNTLIMWCSAETYLEDMVGVNWDFMQMADVRRLVQANYMMKPDRISVNVPAGIFINCDTVSLMMIGFGPGAALGTAQPLPRIQTKTTLTGMLGGKMMEKEMGGMEMPDFDAADWEDE
jgi:hypothetical protein